jgi:hypothetical protein
MATQPVLQAVTLPWPRNPGGYQERRGQRVVNIETAGSNLVFQRITTSAKREFVLSWVALTGSDYTSINSAYDDLLANPTNNNFTAPTGTTYTVTPAPGNPPLEWTYTETPAGARWEVQMRLREISSS